MIVSINQPAYHAWLGYYRRIDLADLHIVLDHVQFEKNSFTNRNRVRTTTAWCWLTVPVRTKGRFGQLPINTLEIPPGGNWQKKHKDTLRTYYADAPFFETYWPFFDDLYARQWNRLLPLIAEIDAFVLATLGITTTLIRSSDLPIQAQKSDLLIKLCQAVGAEQYLSGPLGVDYLDTEAFRRSGIEPLVHQFDPTPYNQVQDPPFVANLAAIDLIFNHGPAGLDTLRSGPEGITVWPETVAAAIA